MKSRTLLVLILPILSACQKTQPANVYRHWADQMIVRTGLINLGIEPCKHAGGTDNCFKMQAPRRWRGTWITHFEDDRFCPGAQPCSLARPRQFRLEWKPSAFRNRSPIQVQTETVYSVDFIGRGTEYPVGTVGGGYTVVVDRLISMKEIGRVPDVKERLAYSISG